MKNKTYKLSIFLILLFFVLFFILIRITEAKEISTPKIYISEDTAKDCRLGIYLWGCNLFWQENGAEVREIYISSKLDVQTFEYTFWHEIFHWFIAEKDEKDLSLFDDNEEVGAYLFALWIMDNPPCYQEYIKYCLGPTDEMKDFFKKLIVN